MHVFGIRRHATKDVLQEVYPAANGSLCGLCVVGLGFRSSTTLSLLHDIARGSPPYRREPRSRAKIWNQLLSPTDPPLLARIGRNVATHQSPGSNHFGRHRHCGAN